jgi:GGDEF domain-containing protein
VETSDLRQILPDANRLAAIAAALEDVVDPNLDLPSALEGLVRRSPALTGADTAVIALAEDDRLVWCFAAGVAEDRRGVTHSLGECAAGACVSKESVLRWDDTSEIPGVDRDVWAEMGVKSLACVPLLAGSSSVGALMVGSSRPGAFEDEDVAAARSLGVIIGASIQSAASAELEADTAAGEMEGRDKYERYLEEQIESAMSSGQPLSLVVIHLDGYLNREDLERLAALVRGADRCYHVDAGDFAIVMPGTAGDGARKAGARIRKAFEQAGGSIKVAFGVAQLRQEDSRDLHAAAHADMAQPMMPHSSRKAAGESGSPQEEAIVLD